MMVMMQVRVRKMIRWGQSHCDRHGLASELLQCRFQSLLI